jgi:hypothetical protein
MLICVGQLLRIPSGLRENSCKEAWNPIFATMVMPWGLVCAYLYKARTNNRIEELYL